jgi:hypothetical protein
MDEKALLEKVKKLMDDKNILAININYRECKIRYQRGKDVSK